MKCPECKKEGLKYIEGRKEKIKSPGKSTIQPRTNFEAKCKFCGWGGKV